MPRCHALTLPALLLFFLTPLAHAQLPSVGGYTAAPDDWLTGQGQPWHYRTRAASAPVPLGQPGTAGAVQPTADEQRVIERAQKLLDGSSAKAMALVQGRTVVWAGFKAPASASTPLLSFSVGKTVTSMAVGQAICQGKLTLATQAQQLVPELQNTALGLATVRELLRMSSGTWEGNRDSTVVTPEQDRALRAGQMSLVDVLVSKPVSQAHTLPLLGAARRPGETFAYRSTDPLTLGVMLNRATGMPYARWVEQQVLWPAGMASPGVIGQDHFGYGQSDGNVRLRLDDWVRFAVWVKELEAEPGCLGDYVREATRLQIPNLSKKSGQSFDGYGYLLWTDNVYQRDSYWAVGHGGQRIGWNHRNRRLLVAFSSVENYMVDLYKLYADWAALP